MSLWAPLISYAQLPCLGHRSKNPWNLPLIHSLLYTKILDMPMISSVILCKFVSLIHRCTLSLIHSAFACSAIWGMEDYYDATTVQREARRLLLSSAECECTTPVLEDGVQLTQMPLRYHRCVPRVCISCQLYYFHVFLYCCIFHLYSCCFGNLIPKCGHTRILSDPKEFSLCRT